MSTQQQHINHIINNNRNHNHNIARNGDKVAFNTADNNAAGSLEDAKEEDEVEVVVLELVFFCRENPVTVFSEVLQRVADKVVA